MVRSFPDWADGVCPISKLVECQIELSGNSLYLQQNIPFRTLPLEPRMQAQQCASRIEPFPVHVALVQQCVCRQAS